MTTIKYPLAKETINNQDIDALCAWLKTYPRLTKGELTWQVEEEWANFIGTRHAVGQYLSSGTDRILKPLHIEI